MAQQESGCALEMQWNAMRIELWTTPGISALVADDPMSSPLSLSGLALEEPVPHAVVEAVGALEAAETAAVRQLQAQLLLTR